jgi:integration host factor subunit alpha
MSITRDDFTNSVHRNTKLPKKQSKELIDAAMELIKSALASGKDVLISGFGKFEVRDKASRNGRNPQTGEALTLRARRVVTFKPSGVLKGKLNGRA